MRRRARWRRGWLYRLLSSAVGATLVSIGIPSGAAAQDSSPPVEIVAVDSSAHPTVTLTVDPPAALAGSDLGPEHFTLRENGEPVPVEVVRVGTAGAAVQETLRVVLVIDGSGSMEGAPLAAAQEAARAFVAQMPKGTQVAVVAFGDTPTVASPMTADRATTLAAIDGIVSAGETALFDAVNLALAQLAEAPVEPASRPAVVLLSDGGDTASRATLDATVAVVRGAGVEVTAVELVTAEYDGTGLRALTDAAAGTVLSADEPARLVTRFETVAADLLNRYLVSYDTTRGGVTEIVLAVSADQVTSTIRRDIRLPAVANAAAVEAPRPRPVDEPGWLGSASALTLGAGLFFVAFALVLASVLLSEREVRVRLSSRLRDHGGRARDRMPAFAEVTQRLGDVAERRLHRSGRDRRLETALEAADVELRPGEFVVLAASVTMGSLLLGALSGGPLLGLALAAVGGAAFPAFLRHRARRRRAAFAEQLGDTLQLLTGSLRAGHSVLQAVDSVATDAPEPTCAEFKRLVVEVRLGRDLREALRAMHQRVGNQDFQWVVEAIEIHRDVGGDLAEILDTVGHTVRERGKLRRHVASLSAEGRLSAVILYAMPFVVGSFLFLLNPEYMEPLLGTGLGMTFLAAGAVSLTVGFFWIRKLIRIEL